MSIACDAESLSNDGIVHRSCLFSCGDRDGLSFRIDLDAFKVSKMDGEAATNIGHPGCRLLPGATDGHLGRTRQGLYSLQYERNLLRCFRRNNTRRTEVALQLGKVQTVQSLVLVTSRQVKRHAG